VNTIKYNTVIDENAELHLTLEPEMKNKPVKVYIVSDDESEDLSLKELMMLLKGNPVYDFLNDPEEDIYTINDGKPYKHDV
jgi:hypothetical protein